MSRPDVPDMIEPRSESPEGGSAGGDGERGCEARRSAEGEGGAVLPPSPHLLTEGAADLIPGVRGPLARLAERIVRHEMFVRHRVILEECGDARGKRVLEVGCGSGRYAIELARRGAAEVVGIDPARGVLAVARRLADAAGVGGLVHFQAVGVHAYRPQDPFDLVVAIGLFDYMSSDEARAAVIRLRELARERVVATFPGRWRLRVPARGLRMTLAGYARVPYSRPELRRLFASVGYREPRVVYSGQVHVVSAVP